MATHIIPFRAFVYNQEKTRDLSKVVCPPYDIISPLDQKYFHQLNPYNLIHLLLGIDIPGEDKYKRAGLLFKKWQKEGVLIQEKKPAIYFYSHEYSLRGERKTRLGFIALIKLSDKNSTVYGHENTHIEATEDRYRLIKQVKANLSPIFLTFLDKKRIIQRAFGNLLEKDETFIKVVDRQYNVHRLWRVDSSGALEKIQKDMSGEHIFIADGHHRYQVACAFRDQMKKKMGSAFTGQESFNYTMAYFTNTDPRSLSILPIHRLLKLNNLFDIKELKNRLGAYFLVEEIKDKARFLFLLEKSGKSEHVLGIYYRKAYWFLRLKNVKFLDEIMPQEPKELKGLDVSILNNLVFKKLLGIYLTYQALIYFSPHAEELIREVDERPPYMAFFLNPVKMQQIIEVALAGKKMPPKSTYFYPKVLSGLVINKFDT